MCPFIIDLICIIFIDHIYLLLEIIIEELSLKDASTLIAKKREKQ